MIGYLNCLNKVVVDGHVLMSAKQKKTALEPHQQIKNPAAFSDSCLFIEMLCEVSFFSKTTMLLQQKPQI